VNIWSNVFRHHRWSNLTLVDFLSELGDAELALTIPGTYGGSLATIRHIVSSDADYVRIIPDTPEVPQIRDDGPFAGWRQLRRVAEMADTVLVAYVDGLVDDMHFVDIDDGESFHLAKSMLLGQIIHHAADHRSQIATTLSANGISAPDLSVWAWRKTDEGRAVLNELSATIRVD
jgi:uncharacterized damage-inducible protein DinB